MNTDLNLLFGVLCLQADLFDATRFAEACMAWTTQHDKPLATLLVERGWITAEERASVELLLQRKLQKHQGDARASLAGCADISIRRILSVLDDSEINRSLAGLPESTETVPPTTTPPP